MPKSSSLAGLYGGIDQSIPENYVTSKQMRDVSKQHAREKVDKSYSMSNMGLPKNFSSQFLPEKRPSGYKEYRHLNFTPAQMELYNQLYGLVDPEGRTSRLAMGDESEFAQMEAPALRQFNQLQGNLASKFSGQGMGSRRSSGFQNSSSAAAQDFASQLQANRQNLQRQSIMDLMGLSQQLLQQGPYTSGYAAKGEKGGIAGGYGAPVGTAIGGLAGAYYGGPTGAATGAATGSGIGGALGGMFD